jgi:23S rRNA (uridine2552-2'-O)-methyltransferase
VVISDMAPDISGNYSTDHARSIWLCDQALAVARRILKQNGHFVCKIFDGHETKRFIDDVKQSFSFDKIYSPEASRKSSSEIYLIAKSFRK